MLVGKECLFPRAVMLPLLERHIRYRFLNQILERRWWGDKLAIIRDNAAHPPTVRYNDVDDENDYQAPFRYDLSTSLDEEVVRTYGQRTAAIVGSGNNASRRAFTRWVCTVANDCLQTTDLRVAEWSTCKIV